MYFVVTSAARAWHLQTVQAGVMFYGFYELQRQMWNCAPLEHVPPLAFTIDRRWPRPDNYFTGNLFQVYSERLIRLLRDSGVHFESWPVPLVDRKTNTELPDRYELFHLLECHRGLSPKSEFDAERRQIYKLVLTQKCLQASPLLFRLQERRNIVLMREDMRMLLKQEGITGFRYVALENYRTDILPDAETD